MAPLFGHHDEDTPPDPDVAAVEREIERVGALPLPELAAEAMAKGFGADAPGGPGRPGTIENPQVSSNVDRVTVGDVAREFAPALRGRNVTPEQALRCNQLIAEGVQLLEHAGLLRAEFASSGVGALSYVATRRGRAAVQQGTVSELAAAADRWSSSGA